MEAIRGWVWIFLELPNTHINFVILVTQTITAFMSHSSYLIRFLVLILGAFTPPPQILDPVMSIPLERRNKLSIIIINNNYQLLIKFNNYHQ